MPDYQTLEHDVLVIGAGGAGPRAAIEASPGGVSVGIASLLDGRLDRLANSVTLNT